jgi:hypothetical protein
MPESSWRKYSMRHFWSSTGCDTSRDSRLLKRALFCGPPTAASTAHGKPRVRDPESSLTSSVDLAGDVVYVCNDAKVAGIAELSVGVVVGGVVALVGHLLVLIGFFGHDAYEQLI